jgi:GcrA cell cycle regulator
MNEWSPELAEELRRLVALKMSAGQIAERLHVTRNSVVGKCHRLKMRLLAQEHRVTIKADRVAAKSVRRDASTPPKFQPKPPVRFEPKPPTFSNAKDPFRQLVPPQELILPTSVQLTVDDMDFARQCRFPLGDPCTAEFRYCGAPSHKERVYCEPHCRLSYIGFQP